MLVGLAEKIIDNFAADLCGAPVVYFGLPGSVNKTIMKLSLKIFTFFQFP